MYTCICSLSVSEALTREISKCRVRCVVGMQPRQSYDTMQAVYVITSLFPPIRPSAISRCKKNTVSKSLGCFFSRCCLAKLLPLAAENFSIQHQTHHMHTQMSKHLAEKHALEQRALDAERVLHQRQASRKTKSEAGLPVSLERVTPVEDDVSMYGWLFCVGVSMSLNCFLSFEC